jgi:hypothetical protein
MLTLSLSDFIPTSEHLTLAATIGSLVVSALTLWLGWAVYQKFLTQKLAETQLSVVLDFVQAIYESEISMWIEKQIGKNIVGHRDTRNLFELSDSEGMYEEEEYANYRVFSSSAFSIEFKYGKFLRNPLLPNAISKELYSFKKGFMSTIDVTKNPGNHVFLGKREVEDGGNGIGAEFKGGYKGFIQHCTALDLSIKSWLKKHGIKDLNQHVVNTSPFDFYTKGDSYKLDEYEYERLLTLRKRIDEAMQSLHNTIERKFEDEKNSSE